MNAPAEFRDELRSVVDSPAMHALEVRLEYARDGAAKGLWRPPGGFLNGNGVVQGGFVGAVCDQIMAAAIASLAGARKFASINLQTTYHRPAMQEEYEVLAQVVRAGKRIAYLTAEVRRNDDVFVSCQSSVILQGGMAEPKNAD